MSVEPSTCPEAVPLGLLRRYLTAHGWRRPDTVGPALSAPPDDSGIVRTFLETRAGGRRNFDLYILSEQGADDVEILLPREQGSSDFLRRVDGAIQTLCDVEGRSPEDVISDVRAIGFDVVRSRIPDFMVQDGTIRLEVAAKYIAGVKGLLAATATTEIKPTPYFERVRPAALEYADHYCPV